MKLPGSPACYCSTGRRFAVLMFIIVDPCKGKTPSSQIHIWGWMRMRKSCEIPCFPLRRGGSLPENMVAQLGNCCTTKCPAQPNTWVWGRVGDDRLSALKVSVSVCGIPCSSVSACGNHLSNAISEAKVVISPDSSFYSHRNLYLCLKNYVQLGLHTVN